MGSDILSAECFESVLDGWKREVRHGCFTYTDGTSSFRRQVAEHFSEMVRPVYGVYVIRSQRDRAILYIVRGAQSLGTGSSLGRTSQGGCGMFAAETLERISGSANSWRGQDPCSSSIWC